MAHRCAHILALRSGNSFGRMAVHLQRFLMSIPDKETVRRVLAINNRGAACRRAVEQAWATVKTSYMEKSWWRRKSTRAALIWEHSVNNAIAALAEDRGVRV